MNELLLSFTLSKICNNKILKSVAWKLQVLKFWSHDQTTCNHTKIIINTFMSQLLQWPFLLTTCYIYFMCCPVCRCCKWIYIMHNIYTTEKLVLYSLLKSLHWLSLGHRLYFKLLSFSINDFIIAHRFMLPINSDVQMMIFFQCILSPGRVKLVC